MADDSGRAISSEEVKARLKALQERQAPQGEDSQTPRTPENKDIIPVKKKPVKKKFRTELKEAIFSGDMKGMSIPKHILFNLFIPAAKRIVADMGNSAINMALGLDPKTRTIGASHVSRASEYAANNRDRNFARTGETPGYSARRQAVSDLIWDEETATDIVTQIADILDRYPSISLSNVYSIMGEQTKIRTTDKYWGWTSMRGIEMVCVDEVDHLYRIEFPPVKNITT